MSLPLMKSFSLGLNVVASVRIQSQRQMGKLNKLPVFKGSRKQPRKWTTPVILREDVPKLGMKGDVVFVKRGYARNELVPNRLAYYGTNENIEQYAVLDRPKDESKMLDPKLMERLEGFTLLFERPRGRVWEIDEHQIARMFRRCGIHTPVHCITLPDGKAVTEFGNSEVILTVDKKNDFVITIAVKEWLPRIDETWEEFIYNENNTIDYDKFHDILDGIDAEI